MSTATEQSHIGKVVGSFRIVKLLGRGGMGAVFLGQHSSVELRVAIKLLRDPLADEAAVARFQEEAKALSRLDHPSLVRLHDCGALPDGTLYLQMEYLSGQPMPEYVRAQGGRLPVETVLRLGRQMASALSYVHEQGVLHRDLKPSNLYVIPDRETAGGQRVKILDFGIAKLRSAAGTADPATASGQLLGTPRYMSPEQCEGGAELDERSDVYSLGLILFELLTGESPYLEPREPMGWLYSHVEKRPRALRQLLPEAPEALAALITKMLDKLAAQRPSMIDVEAAIGALLAGPTALVPATVPATTPAPAIAQRKPNLPLLLGAAAMVALLGVAGVLWRIGVFTKSGAAIHGNGQDSEVRARVLSAMQTRSPRGMVVVPGGRFVMGSDEAQLESALATCQHERKDCRRDEYERERPQRAVTVSDFYLDKYEVTNAEYAAFLNLPLRPSRVEQERLVYVDRELLVDLHPKASGIVLQDSKFTARTGAERKPVVQVTWQGAYEYCAAQGRRLPTEAEWELAARSGLRQAPYPFTGFTLSTFPWGNEPPRCDGVIIARTAELGCHAATVAIGPAEIGSATQDRTPQGVFDLAGNVREWIEDEFRVPYPNCGTCVNPRVGGGLSAGNGAVMRGVRGSSFQQEPTAARGAGRSRWRADYLATGIGFRCAANPEQLPESLAPSS